MADYTDFKRLGHPGKWRGIRTVAKNTEFEFTGSNYGAAALFFENDTTGIPITAASHAAVPVIQATA